MKLIHLFCSLTIFAVNKFGSSDPSIPVEFRTLAPLPGVPIIRSVTNISSTNLRINWEMDETDYYESVDFSWPSLTKKRSDNFQMKVDYYTLELAKLDEFE